MADAGRGAEVTVVLVATGRSDWLLGAEVLMLWLRVSGEPLPMERGRAEMRGAARSRT